jgi:hypothetical protein
MKRTFTITGVAPRTLTRSLQANPVVLSARLFATLPSEAKVIKYHATGQPEKVLKYALPPRIHSQPISQYYDAVEHLLTRTKLATNRCRLETEKLPQVGDNDVLVGFLAAPINPADLNMVEGVYPIGPKAPAVGGNEGVAEVLAVGSKVKGIAVDDWVIPAKPGFGTPLLLQIWR